MNTHLLTFSTFFVFRKVSYCFCLLVFRLTRFCSLHFFHSIFHFVSLPPPFIVLKPFYVSEIINIHSVFFLIMFLLIQWKREMSSSLNSLFSCQQTGQISIVFFSSLSPQNKNKKKLWPLIDSEKDKWEQNANRQMKSISKHKQRKNSTSIETTSTKPSLSHSIMIRNEVIIN